jgi:DNA sulfur modification protein DndE
LCRSLNEKILPTQIDIPADSNVEMTWQVFGGEHHELDPEMLRQRRQNDGSRD